MKKTKFMVGTLVLSMGLLGTGYAYWADSFTVNASVNTGKLEVNVIPGEMSYKYTSDSGNLAGEDVLDYMADDATLELKDAVTIPNTLEARWPITKHNHIWLVEPCTETCPKNPNYNPGGGDGGGDQGVGDGSGEDNNTVATPLKEITFNIPEMHPGTQFTYNFKLEDKTTIPTICSVTGTSVAAENEVYGLEVALQAPGGSYTGTTANPVDRQLVEVFDKAFTDTTLEGLKNVGGDYVLAITMPKEVEGCQGLVLENFVLTMNWNQINEKAPVTEPAGN